MQMELPQLFEKVNELKRERRDLKDSVKAQLEGHSEYQRLQGVAQDAKAQMKEIVREVTQAVAGTRLEEIAVDLKCNAEVMADVSLTMLAQGKEVKIEDKYGRELRPQFSVKFVKA